MQRLPIKERVKKMSETNNLTFEEAMAKLEDAVAQLEGGDEYT